MKSEIEMASPEAQLPPWSEYAGSLLGADLKLLATLKPMESPPKGDDISPEAIALRRLHGCVGQLVDLAQKKKLGVAEIDTLLEPLKSIENLMLTLTRAFANPRSAAPCGLEKKHFSLTGMNAKHLRTRLLPGLRQELEAPKPIAKEKPRAKLPVTDPDTAKETEEQRFDTIAQHGILTGIDRRKHSVKATQSEDATSGSMSSVLASDCTHWLTILQTHDAEPSEIVANTIGDVSKGWLKVALEDENFPLKSLATTPDVHTSDLNQVCEQRAQRSAMYVATYQSMTGAQLPENLNAFNATGPGNVLKNDAPQRLAGNLKQWGQYHSDRNRPRESILNSSVSSQALVMVLVPVHLMNRAAEFAQKQFEEKKQKLMVIPVGNHQYEEKLYGHNLAFQVPDYRGGMARALTTLDEGRKTREPVFFHISRLR
jgi:hypothetical protein